MASPAGISIASVMDYHTFHEAYAAASADDKKTLLQWRVHHLFENIHGDQVQQNAIATPAVLSAAADVVAQPLQLIALSISADAKAAIIAAQHRFSASSKARARGAKIFHQQRQGDLKNEILLHQSAIATLTVQLAIMRAQHAAEHTSFDMLDAHDLQLEDERRLPASAVLARAERESKRLANGALVATMRAELDGLAAKIALAKSAFEAQVCRATVATARTSLRELRVLKAHKGAKVPKGEHKLAFWNAVRRALTKQSPSGEDVERFEEYKRELEGPVLLEKDVCDGIPPALEVVEEWPELGEERDGMFSVSGWQL